MNDLTNYSFTSQPLADVITLLTSYIRKISQEHYLVNGYLFANKYDLNDYNSKYPLVTLAKPLNFITVFNPQGNQSIQIRCELLFLTNGVYTFDDVTNPVFTQLSLDSKDENVTYESDLFNNESIQNLMLSQMYNIANDYINKFKSDYSNGDSPFDVLNANIATLERVYNNDSNGVSLSLTLNLTDPYKCSFKNSFIRNTQTNNQ